jgi:unconventional prefoldin RPB5 interactor 1
LSNLEEDAPPIETETAPKKAVTFAEDTKPGPDMQPTKTAKRLEEIMNTAKSQNEPITETPVIPTGDSPEEAALRKEMLKYGMSEVGAVVAELDLEDADTDDEGYDDDTSSMDDEEDEFGRSTGQVVDDEMRRRMRELEERLGVRMMENVGPKSDIDVVHEGIGTIRIKQEDGENATEVGKEVSVEKKAVRFADKLDISPSPVDSNSSSQVKKSKKQASTTPFGDVVERNVASSLTSITPTTGPEKVSRFKSARAGKAPSVPFIPPLLPYVPPTRERIVPTGPAGMPLAPGVIEREIPVGSAMEPDELDPALMQQQVATEYHRMRNRMIQKQGGFLKDDVDEDGRMEFDEEEGGPKKMSRFMAARLARS